MVRWWVDWLLTRVEMSFLCMCCLKGLLCVCKRQEGHGVMKHPFCLNVEAELLFQVSELRLILFFLRQRRVRDCFVRLCRTVQNRASYCLWNLTCSGLGDLVS